MPTINTYNKMELQNLAYALTDPYANLTYNQAVPALDAGKELGKFRKKDVRTYFQDFHSTASKFTHPEVSNSTDAFLDFFIKPISKGFEFSNADLGDPMSHGYSSRIDMIGEEMQVKTSVLKKIKEQMFYAFVSDNTNFAGATYYADASTAWSTVATADTLADIEAGRAIVEASGYRLNAGIINRKTLGYLRRNALINSATTVMGTDKNMSVNPRVEVEFLKSYWGLDYLWIADGSFITDSSDPTDTTMANIWGNKMLLFDYNIGAIQSPRQPSWCKQLFWRPDGKGDTQEGWIVNESQDFEAGGVGLTRWGIWNYFTFLSHEPRLAYRIDALYA